MKGIERRRGAVVSEWERRGLFDARIDRGGWFKTRGDDLSLYPLSSLPDNQRVACRTVWGRRTCSFQDTRSVSKRGFRGFFVVQGLLATIFGLDANESEGWGN
jgi:hypothetical protein